MATSVLQLSHSQFRVHHVRCRKGWDKPETVGTKRSTGILLAPSARSRQLPDSARSRVSHEPRLGRFKVEV
jgi:hypothetical protein